MQRHVDSVEHSLGMNIEKLSREIERLKFDLTDLIEQKQEQMQKNFTIELGGIKKRYEDAVNLVTDASANLGGLFKNKMVKIKTKTLKFFADMEIRMAETNKDVIGIGNIVNDWREKILTPAQKFEA